MLGVQVEYWKLKEAERSNLMQESLKRSELGIRSNELQESIRSHKASEQIAWANYEEASRHNRQIEAINWYDAETQRNLANSNILLNNATTALRQAQAATEQENLRQTQARTSLYEQQTKEKEKDVLWYEAGLAGSIMNSKAGLLIAGGTGAAVTGGASKIGNYIKNVIKGQTTTEIVNRQKVAP